MGDILAGYSAVIYKVQNLMKNLKYPIPAARLRHLRYLNAQIANETRWCSMYNMLSQYAELKWYIEQQELQKVSKLQLNEEGNLLDA